MTIATLTQRLRIFGAAGALCLAGSIAHAEASSEPSAQTREDRFPISIDKVQSHTEARFAKLDSDGNGALNAQEFEAGQAYAGARHCKGKRHSERRTRGHHQHGARRHTSPEQRAEMKAAVDAELFGILDADDNGQISAMEFASNSHENRRLAQRRAMFKRLDADGSGTLSITEMPSPVDHLRAADTDGDGEVTRAEMRAARQARAAG
jgi:Ca2+-binding EF-hand superfamily protein